MFPMTGWIWHLLDRLPGGHQASSLAPLHMNNSGKDIRLALDVKIARQITTEAASRALTLAAGIGKNTVFSRMVTEHGAKP
jgi:hypothetical protein